VTEHLIIAGSDPEALDPLLVGHKFARQAQLLAAGYRVPEFVCLPAAAFDRMMAGAKESLQEPATDPGEHTRWAAEAYTAVLRAGVPAALVDPLLAHFDRLAGVSGVVAVRSCAVPQATQDGGRSTAGEDSASDPFAGLGHSFLAVGQDELISKVAACWASAFTPEGVLYRAARGADPAATRMAVGIQRLVPACRSFVAFSRDPRGSRADGRCLIAAAHGLGEGVVQERADIDHFFVDPATGEVERQVLHKTRQVVAAGTGGTIVTEVPAELADEPVLDPPTALRVAELARSLEQFFGTAQDIEGALTMDGELYVLQARPVVNGVARRKPSELHWSNGNIAESYSGLTSALTFSVASELYAVGLEGLYRCMGVPEKDLRRNRYELRRLLGYLDGRIYMRLESWYALHSRMRAFLVLKRQWEKAVVTVDSSVLMPEPGQWRRWALLAREVPAAVARRVLHLSRMRRFFVWWEARREALPDPATRSPAEIVQDYRELWADVALRWGGTLVNNTYVIGEFGLVERLMRRWAPEAGRGVLNGMLCDGPVNRSVLAVRSLLDLADGVAGVRQARQAVLEEKDPAEIWRRLSTGELGQDVADQARRHLDRYGDRGLHDLKIETVVPTQRPELLVGQLRSAITTGRTTRASVEEERRIRRDAEETLLRTCRGPVRRIILLVLFRSLRGHLRIREDLRFCRTELIGVSRRMVLALAGHLVAAGQLDVAADVYDLTISELLGAYEGTATVELRPLARLRAAGRRAASERTDPPNVFASDADRPVAMALPTSASDRARSTPVLTGLASSGGVVRGRAQVITDPVIDPESCRDRILITRETDPGWLLLMLVAKGLVAERGTVLSHTAITGRIFGIPTVVAVSGAVDRIPDGALVEVDGDRGTVTVIDEEFGSPR
jgi:rifampicin phosphotransferase